MPNVVGERRDRAQAELQDRGLIVNVFLVPRGPGAPPDTVVFQSPPERSTVRAGDQVTIYVTST
jgi:beta-lactam-binding protein with PASTA domain